jgi:hypothetical protein
VHAGPPICSGRPSRCTGRSGSAPTSTGWLSKSRDPATANMSTSRASVPVRRRHGRQAPRTMRPVSYDASAEPVAAASPTRLIERQLGLSPSDEPDASRSARQATATKPRWWAPTGSPVAVELWSPAGTRRGVSTAPLTLLSRAQLKKGGEPDGGRKLSRRRSPIWLSGGRGRKVRPSVPLPATLALSMSRSTTFCKGLTRL